jgi:hypothetical protein
MRRAASRSCRTIRDNLSRPGAVLVVTVRPEVAEAVVNQQRQTLAELEKLGRKTIFIRGDHRLAYEDVECGRWWPCPTTWTTGAGSRRPRRGGAPRPSLTGGRHG